MRKSALSFAELPQLGEHERFRAELGMSQPQPADGLKEAVLGHARSPRRRPTQCASPSLGKHLADTDQLTHLFDRRWRLGTKVLAQEKVGAQRAFARVGARLQVDDAVAQPAVHMQCTYTCSAHTHAVHIHMQCTYTCSAHAHAVHMHMQCACSARAHAVRMQCPCCAHAGRGWRLGAEPGPVAHSRPPLSLLVHMYAYGGATCRRLAARRSSADPPSTCAPSVRLRVSLPTGRP